MARQALLSLGTRFSAGHGLWSIAAFLFPSLAIANGERLSIAMGLFLLETVAAIAVLSARLGVSWLASRADPEARARMGKVVHGLKGVLLTGIIGAGWGLALALASLQAEPAGVSWASFADRATWMLGTLLATAVLDSVIAPVRSPVWLETNLAWQASRSSVIVVSVLVGLPIALYQRSMDGFFWAFLGLRLLADFGGFKPGERERIRSLMFDAPVPSGPRPMPRSPRSGIEDPRRLPP